MFVVWANALMKADKMLYDIRQNLAVSGVEAYKLNNQFNFMVLGVDNLHINIRSIREALMAMNDSYGTALVFNEETLKTSAEILNAKLMDGEATANLAMMTRVNGQ